MSVYFTFTQIQDGQHSARPSLPKVIIGNAGVETSITGFAVPNPKTSVLLVLHVEELIVVVPVQGGLGVSSHSHLKTDVATCSHGGVPHFANEHRWRWVEMAGAPLFRHYLLRACFRPFGGDDGTRRGCCFICPLFEGPLCISFSHGGSDLMASPMKRVCSRTV